MVDGFGRVRTSLGQGEIGTIVTSLPPPQPESLFARLGLYPVAVLALLLALAGWLVERYRPPPPPRADAHDNGRDWDGVKRID